MNMIYTRSIVFLVGNVLFAQTVPTLTSDQQRDILFQLAEIRSMESDIQAFQAQAIQQLNEEIRKRQIAIGEKKKTLEEFLTGLKLPDGYEVTLDSATRKVLVTKKAPVPESGRVPATVKGSEPAKVNMQETGKK